MALTIDTKNDFSFRALINREFTTTAKKFYNEFGANTINMNTSEIWSQDVSSTPSTAVSAGVAKQYTEFVLSPLAGYTTSAFYVASGSGWTPGDEVNRGTINLDYLQRNFISDKYGANYAVTLKDGSGEDIYPLDDIDWLFNYQTGILTIQSSSLGTYNYDGMQLSGYQYVGTFLSESAGGESGIFVQTGSFFATTNDLQVTGSIIADSITSSFQGDLDGTAATASYVTTAQTASYVVTAQTASFVTTAQTASYVAGASVDGAVANATDAATAAALATNATGDNLTLSGNLQVAGTASFTNATNLSVKDKYILLASGSAAASDGGIAVEQAADGKSKLFAYDSTENRWAVTSSFDPLTAAGYDPDAYMPLTISGSIIADIPASYNQEGNMFVDSSNDSWIYTDKWSKIIVSGSAASFSGLTVDGNASVTGTLVLGDITNVSASIAALEADPGGVFVQTGSKFNTTNDLEITGSLIVSSSTAIPIQASGQSINIGSPVDNSYADGFFDSFTSATSLAQAMDEISVTFASLVPNKAGILGSTSLTGESTTTGLLPSGLESARWYVGKVAGDSIGFITDPGITLTTADTSTRFRAGTKAQLDVSSIPGGVTGSIAKGSDAAVLSIQALAGISAGGSSVTGAIRVFDLAQFGTNNNINYFWAKANAQIITTATDSGSYKFIISADNGAGSSNERQFWYVGNSSEYPNQTITPGSVTTSASTLKKISGIDYLQAATFSIPFTADEMFSPVYSNSNVLYSSGYFSNATTGSQAGDIPAHDAQMSLTIDRTLSSNLPALSSTGELSAPTATIRVSKPGKSNVTSTSITLNSTYFVNSYTSDPAANLTEYFLGEGKRLTAWNGSIGGWNSTSALVDGNLQVQNGRLIGGQQGDYPAFGTGDQYYWREFAFPGSQANQDISTYAFGQVGFGSNLGAWGSGADIEIIAARPEDGILSTGVPTIVYDFAVAALSTNGNKSIPDNSGGTATAAVRGLKVGGTLGELSGNCSMGSNTLGASAKLVLLVRFSSAQLASKYLTQLSLT